MDKQEEWDLEDDWDITPIPDPPKEQQLEPKHEKIEFVFEEEIEVLPNLVYCPLSGTELSTLDSAVLKDIRHEKFLGSGSYGQVCEMTALYRPNEEIPWHLLRQRSRFAVKFVCVPNYMPLNTLMELQILSKLRHENICNMMAALLIPDPLKEYQRIVCLFLEFCHGTLNQLIDQVGKPRILSENLSRHWFAQIVRALQYIHGMNIAHLDIKEDNIMYRSYENPSNTFEKRFFDSIFKLTDFGISETGGPSIQSFKKQDITHLFEVLTQSIIPNIDCYSLDVFIRYCETSDEVGVDIPPEWGQISSALKDLCCRMYSVYETIGTTHEVLTATDILNHSWIQNIWHLVRRRHQN